MSQLFLNNKTKALVEVASIVDGVVSFASQGGGFMYKLNEDKFNEDFKKVTPKEVLKFRAEKFHIDGAPDDAELAGYTTGQRWNGWACPYFLKSEIEKIIRFCSTEEYPISYKVDTEQVVCHTGGIEEEPEIFDKVIITVDGKKIETWPVGAGSWCWTILD